MDNPPSTSFLSFIHWYLSADTESSLLQSSTTPSLMNFGSGSGSGSGSIRSESRLRISVTSMSSTTPIPSSSTPLPRTTTPVPTEARKISTESMPEGRKISAGSRGNNLVITHHNIIKIVWVHLKSKHPHKYLYQREPYKNYKMCLLNNAQNFDTS